MSGFCLETSHITRSHDEHIWCAFHEWFSISRLWRHGLAGWWMHIFALVYLLAQIGGWYLPTVTYSSGAPTSYWIIWGYPFHSLHPCLLLPPRPSERHWCGRKNTSSLFYEACALCCCCCSFSSVKCFPSTLSRIQPRRFCTGVLVRMEHAGSLT